MDGITIHLLNTPIQELLEPLTSIINLGISQEIFPKQLKQGLLIPIYEIGH